MKRLLIVFYSVTGATEQMARAAFSGAQSEPALDSVVKRADQTFAEDVIGADGLLFATPENLASMAGIMKDFFDRTYYSVLDRINGRPYASMVAAGTDGTSAARQLERIATGWRLRSIAPALIVVNRAQSAAEIAAPKLLHANDLQRCEELGAVFATGLAAGVF